MNIEKHISPEAPFAGLTPEAIVVKLFARAGVYIYAHALERDAAWRTAALKRWLHVTPVASKATKNSVVVANLNAAGYIYARTIHVWQKEGAHIGKAQPPLAVQNLMRMLCTEEDEGATYDLSDTSGKQQLREACVAQGLYGQMRDERELDRGAVGIMYMAVGSALTLLASLYEWPYFFTTYQHQRVPVQVVCCAAHIEIIALATKAVIAAARQRLDLMERGLWGGDPHDALIESLLEGFQGADLGSNLKLAQESMSVDRVMNVLGYCNCLLGHDGEFNRLVYSPDEDAAQAVVSFNKEDAAHTNDGRLILSIDLLDHGVLEIIAPDTLEALKAIRSTADNEESES